MEIGRREFLKLLGITGTAAVTGSWAAHMLLDIPEKVFTRLNTGSLTESWKNSLCTKCSGGCALRVRLIDNIPVNITGNPDYPINRGAICPLAVSGIETLFHPDRIKQPLKRTGPRGSDNWEPISWQEATDIVSGRLRKLLSKGTPEKLALITDDYHSLASVLVQRIFNRFGSPNILFSGYQPTFDLAANLAHGAGVTPTFDFAHADLIMNFDLDVLDEPLSPIYFNQIYGNSNAHIIHLSSYQSRTAVKSSEWHPIKVGTSGALALGMANVIVRDKTYDSTFINKHTFGFEDWTDNEGKSHLGFKQFVLSEYSPEKVADITGLSGETIIDLARQFALSNRAFAIGGGQSSENTNGSYNQYAIYCLNALKGNINQEGGVLFPRQDYFPVSDKSKSSSGHSNMVNAFSTFEHFLAKMEGEEAPIDTLFIQQADPALLGKRLHQTKRFMNNVPYIVYVGSFKNDSALQADLILPEPGELESWNASYAVPTIDFPHFVVQRPTMDRVDDTQQFCEFLLKIGQSIDSNSSENLPWKDFPAFIKSYAKSLYEGGKGVIVSEKVDYSWIEFLKERGWQPMKHSSFFEFWKLLLKNGGWWDPGYELIDIKNLFKNESGKFEFYSSYLNTSFQNVQSNNGSTDQSYSDLLNELHIEARGDYAFLPHYEKAISDNTNYPVQLLPFWLIGNWDQSGAQLGLVQEMSGLYSREYWNLWAELNPQTANIYGIEDGDMIDVITENRALTVKAKLRPTVMPDSVVLPMGRFFATGAENITQLFSEDMDRMSGISSLYSTRVRIRKSSHQKRV